MTIVTQPALAFVRPAVLANGHIDDHFSWEAYTQDHYALLFFYPLDFTFVCPSELIALNRHMSAFTERGIKVAAISVDSVFSHRAWRLTPQEEGGIGPLDFPLISDLDHSICQFYQVEHPEHKVALRSAVVIDKKGIVRAHITHDLPIGRHIEEMIRVFDALDHSETFGEVCPAGWARGKAAMTASPEGVADYLRDHLEDL